MAFSFRTHLALLTAILLTGITTGPARAVLVTYQFGGQIDTVADSMGSFGVTAGDTFSGTFIYDTAMALNAMASGPGNSLYEQPSPIAPLAFSVTINSVTYSAGNSSAPLKLQVTNNASGLHDQFVFLTSQGTLVHPLMGSYPSSSMALSLRDTSDSIFNSTAIPTTLDLIDFDVATFSMDFKVDPGDPDGVMFLGTVTSLSAVPETSSMVLVCLPVTAMWLRQKLLGRRQKHC